MVHTGRANRLRLTALALSHHPFSGKGHRKAIQAAHTSLRAKHFVYDCARPGIHHLNRHWAGGSPTLVDIARTQKGEKKESVPRLGKGPKADVGMLWIKL